MWWLFGGHGCDVQGSSEAQQEAVEGAGEGFWRMIVQHSFDPGKWKVVRVDECRGVVFVEPCWETAFEDVLEIRSPLTSFLPIYQLRWDEAGQFGRSPEEWQEIYDRWVDDPGSCG